MKSCFENCQRLMMAVARAGLDERVRYCEGWATSMIPIEHAWLEVDGVIVDLTLDDVAEYGAHRTFDATEVMRRLCIVQVFGPLSNLWEINPYTGGER